MKDEFIDVFGYAKARHMIKASRMFAKTLVKEEKPYACKPDFR